MSVDFVCPKCKLSLCSDDNTFYCKKCDLSYPIISGIPDFISGDLQVNLTPILRLAKKADFLAPIYESRIWYRFCLKVGGAYHSSVESIASFHSKSLKGISGNILDVACGPATYCRRIVSSTRSVYGIDISMGMLKKGLIYVARDHISGVHLARARVEELPFGDAVFDGAICSGSLHLFPDTVSSLREIARTMKVGSPLTVQTFIKGNTGINAILRLFKIQKEVHSFDLNNLQRYLAEAGFEGFQSEMDGTIITFSVHKAM